MPAIPWIDRETLDNPSSPYADTAIEMASYVLWELSGRRFSGEHTVLEQYECACTRFSGLPTPFLYDGQIYNRRTDPYAAAGGCCGDCGLQGAALRLRGKPVRSVDTVWHRGTELDPTSWELLDHALLRFRVSVDICACIEVAYNYGTQPPGAGQLAAASLANQLILGATGSPECRLPERVTSVSRQGVSWTLLDPQEFLADGRTGLYEVDLFLATVNPYKTKRRPRVFSPDQPRASRRIT